MTYVTGARYTVTNNLGPAGPNHAFGYDPNVNPSSIAEFVGAAFRSLHSSVQGFIRFAITNSYYIIYFAAFVLVVSSVRIVRR